MLDVQTANLSDLDCLFGYTSVQKLRDLNAPASPEETINMLISGPFTRLSLFGETLISYGVLATALAAKVIPYPLPSEFETNILIGMKSETISKLLDLDDTLLLAKLLRNMISTEITPPDVPPQPQLFIQFLTIARYLKSDPDITSFLKLVIAEKDMSAPITLENFCEYLKDPSNLSEQLSVNYEFSKALSGFTKFLDFAEDIYHLTEVSVDAPPTRLAVWSYYAPLFVRLNYARERFLRLVTAVKDCGTQEVDEDFRQQSFARLVEGSKAVAKLMKPSWVEEAVQIRTGFENMMSTIFGEEPGATAEQPDEGQREDPTKSKRQALLRLIGQQAYHMRQQSS